MDWRKHFELSKRESEHDVFFHMKNNTPANSEACPRKSLLF